MDEVVEWLQIIASKLERTCDQLDSISTTVFSIEVRIENVETAITTLNGFTGKDLGDVYDKLDDAVTAIEQIRGSTGYDLTDIHETLSSADSKLYELTLKD